MQNESNKQHVVDPSIQTFSGHLLSIYLVPDIVIATHFHRLLRHRAFLCPHRIYNTMRGTGTQADGYTKRNWNFVQEMIEAQRIL